MLNHITIAGRLTKDVELRHTSTNTPVASFTIACDRDFKDANGNKGTDFVECVAWRNTADFVSRYFNKGKMAIVSGRLQIRDYEDKEGNKRRSAEVVADQVYFGDSKKEASGSNYGGFAPDIPPVQDYAQIDESDESLPF
jgi:single-strand DNA-binding protein